MQSEPRNRRVGGFFAGFRTGPMPWLREADIIYDEGFSGGPRATVASLIEADWAFRRGHNLKLAYVYQDPDRRIQDDGQTRTSGVYAYTPIQFLQLRVGSRRYKRIPHSALQYQTLAIVELHAFM